MDSCRGFFGRYFPALSGHCEPFAWQGRLFEQFCDGDIPDAVSIPTGCGKTSVMPIWLLALAFGAPVPRRLVWIVNRRVVVDQATDEAAGMALRLDTPPVAVVRAALSRLQSKADGRPLAISTLRGQFADNAEWRNDPARPAVITGTVDMVGSRLLFSGYGCGFKSRPLHASFLGQDALLVHDEAHLEPAFQSLIEAIRDEQRAAGDFRPLRTMQLTATTRDAVGGFTLSAEEMAEREVAARVNARKGIRLHAVAGQKDVAAEVAARALELRGSGEAVLVFLQRVADVDKVARQIEKAACIVQRLTGTMRGHERDDLVRDNGILARFLGREGKSGTVYLVSTSAGEVGINLSADHAICDLTPFDSMAQRLGRVNRFGAGDARVAVVHYAASEKLTPFEAACERTLALFCELPVREDGRLDASPSALGRLDAEKRAAAFSPTPAILPTSDILFDRWALTTIRGPLPGRPPVADWLHGVEEGEPSQTHVAWRTEVEFLSDTRQYDLAELLEDYPLKPHELLRDASLRVVEQLEKIAARVDDEDLWIVSPDDSVRAAKLSEVLKGDKKKTAQSIANCTLILPPRAGGLEQGFLSGDARFADGAGYDISDRWLDENGVPRRVRLWDDEELPTGMRLVRTVDIGFGRDEECEEGAGRRYWQWLVRPRTADDDGSRSANSKQELNWHCKRAETHAVQLAAALGLERVEAEALRVAAAWHDRGKDRDLWQRSIGNLEYPRVKLAKSGTKGPPVQASGYRHEFGSLLEMGSEISDLALHMVAAHHGRARPHFPDEEAFDPKYPDGVAGTAADQAVVRFLRLQKQYGRWGLAYLESLLRAADSWASQDEMTLEASA